MAFGLFWTARGAFGQGRLLPPPPIQAAAAIVVNGNTGAALWAKNPDKRLPPASTTKIVTGLLLARDVPPDQPVTASPNAAQTPGHALGMKPGETFRARDLLYAIMLASANDASVAAAEHSARSEPAFADRMNAFASQNHAPNTHFANASGLPASGHYSTARDLAALARAALQNPDFAAVVRTRAYALKRSGSRPGLPSLTPLVNENTLLGVVPGMDGVKAGWTQEAGACFVGSATRSGQRILTVVLNSPDWKRETAALVEYGFAALPRQTGQQGAAEKQSTSNSAPPLTGNTRSGTKGGAINPVPAATTPKANAVSLDSHALEVRPFSGRRPVGGTPHRQVVHGLANSAQIVELPAIGRLVTPVNANAPFPASAPESGASGLPDWNLPTLPVAGSQGTSVPHSPDLQNGRGGRDARNRAPFPPTSAVPPAARPSRLPALLLAGGFGVLMAALLLARKRRFTMPELPFGLFGRRRKREPESRAALAELYAAPQPRPLPVPPPPAPAFTFAAPLLLRLTGPAWLETTLDTPTRLLEPAVRRQACAVRDAAPCAGDAKIFGMLHAPSGRTRTVAAELLMTHAPRHAEETLLGMFKDEHTGGDVRADAAQMLAQAGGDRHERLWLQMLLRDGFPPAAHALARLPRLEDATAQALRHVLTTSGEGRETDGELKRHLRHAQIAAVLLAQGHFTRPQAAPFFNALPANHGEPILVATLRGSRQPDAVECLIEIVLRGHAYPALQSLLDADPRLVRQILDPLTPTLDLAAQTRATILRWLLLGEGSEGTIQELAAAGNDLARGALQLGRMHHWQPATVPPDALLAAAQIYSLRLGFSLHAHEDIAYAFRKAATDGEAHSLAALPPELQPLAHAYAHPEVYEAVQVAMHTEDGLPALLATLARHPENPAYRQEMAFWCDKMPHADRLFLTRALCAVEESANEETTCAAIADRAADPDARIRGAALRWLRAHPEQPKTESATHSTNEREP